MNILFASSEMSPFAKTGGLGDVLGALPATLKKRGHSVACVLPLYRGVMDKLVHPTPSALSFPVRLAGADHSARIWTATTQEGVRLFLIQHDGFFDRAALYGESGDYSDNASRFIFFSKAVIALARHIQPLPQILHSHDWQTGLLAAFTQAEGLPFKNVFTIHNLAYQGAFWGLDFALTNLPSRYFSPAGVEFYGQLNMMKAGIVLADQVTTVSPRYAQEIQTPSFGCGLDRVLSEQQGKLNGILNGVDYQTWNPATDEFLAEKYDASRLRGKMVCKNNLQRTLKLRESEAPLFGCITRLADQKGVDLIASVIEQLLNQGAQFVLLGSGEQRMEEFFLNLAARHPDQVAVKIGFDIPLSHQIEAGSDFFLMPSRYEPCGLTQMYSLRYGTLPIAHRTGGLADTILDSGENPTLGNGFLYSPNTPNQLWAACQAALRLYPKKGDLLRVRRAAMKAEFSWDQSAQAYEEVYQKVLI